MTFPKVVLFIDDDADDRAIFGEAAGLVNPSIQRIYATHGLEALEMLSKEDALIPDLIFLDINMPVMNGIECLEALKKIPALATIPVIICSTSAYSGDKQQCEALGADFYLVKPNTLLKMSTALQFVFSRYTDEKSPSGFDKSLVA